MISEVSASREHEFCYGHRVVGHEGKCKALHGHNGRVRFTVTANTTGDLDAVGRVIDFSVIKEKLCQWLEDNWDHRMLLWDSDLLAEDLHAMDHKVVLLPFNPTAENLALHLLHNVGPDVFSGMKVRLTRVEFHETAKCSVEVSL